MRRGEKVGGGMTFTLSTYGAGILPSRPLSGMIWVHSSVPINTRPNIVHTKHWLFNEIPVAVFHLTFLVKVPVMFHFIPISTADTSEPQGGCWKY